MKNLQDTHEINWQFQAIAQMTGVIRSGNSPRQCFLLLHGLSERGRRIYRKLIGALPENDLVIAPNGLFPLPRLKENKMDMGHAWYIYDRFEKKYLIDKSMAISWLQEVLKKSNPTNLPLTIIGFSQGGYLAPELAKVLPATKLVIGIGCTMYSHLLTDPIQFPIECIHGTTDPVVDPVISKNEIHKIKDRGYKANWLSLENTSHEINSDVVKSVKEIIQSYGT